MRVLVTGASTGIGLATALRFARAGHEVFAGVRRPEAVPDDAPFTKLRLDVTSDAAVSEAVRRTGPVDVLINNAGIVIGGPVETAAIADAKAVFETNYFGAVRMIRAVLPVMRERGVGTIVNVTSVAARVGSPTHAHYAASKSALETLSECLAQEAAGFGVRVAIVEPGVVDTPIFAKDSGTPDDAGPYRVHAERLRRYFQSRLREGANSPELVAEVIENAVTTSDPRLRYVVGQDAEAVIRVREAITDEEWIRLRSVLDDNEYYKGMKALFQRVLAKSA
jgi:NAD(P)-dependent dehydrogenase (short-subunit alcohol dehydrogenase family)